MTDRVTKEIVENAAKNFGKAIGIIYYTEYNKINYSNYSNYKPGLMLVIEKNGYMYRLIVTGTQGRQIRNLTQYLKLKDLLSHIWAMQEAIELITGLNNPVL